MLTYYWIIATVVYFGVTAAVTWASWTLDFSFAFVLGQLFIWLALASLGCWLIARWGLEREKAWWDKTGYGTESQDWPVNANAATRPQEEREREHEYYNRDASVIEMSQIGAY